MNFITAFLKEWLEQRRTKKFLIALIVLTLFGMTSPLLAKFTPPDDEHDPRRRAFAGLIPEPTINDAVAQYLKNMSQFGILLACSLAWVQWLPKKKRVLLLWYFQNPCRARVSSWANFQH
jgi:ABC-type transport system involved in multi-copper enzyme maturation permease subunit